MRNHLTIIVLLFIFQFNFAQDNKDEAYSKAVDFVTCICINDALPDGQIKFDCANETIDKVPVTDSKTIDLYNELQNLKNTPRISDYSKFLSEDIFNDEKKFNKIYSFANNSRRKGAKISEIKASIKEYINNSASSTSQLNKLQLSKDSSDEGVDIDESDSSEPYSLDIKQNDSNLENSLSSKFNLWIGILFGLIILMIILVTRIYFLFNKDVQNLKDKFDHSKKMQESPKISSNQNSPRLNEISRIEKLESRIKDLENLLSVPKLSTNNYKEEKSPQLILAVPKAQTRPAVVFYMATPNKDDGSFDISSQTESFKPTQSLYKFTVDNVDSSKAKFEFFSDEAGIRDSIDSPQTYIDPVCEPQNARNPTSKKIITVSPGIAEKTNDKWVIITTAKIKYE